MPRGNKSVSEFKGTDARELAEHYSLTPDMFTNTIRSYTVPSTKINKEKKITLNDIKWYIDQYCYFYFGTYLYSENNITIEYRYDTDLIQYTKEEFKNYYGINNYDIHWNLAPVYNFNN